MPICLEPPILEQVMYNTCAWMIVMPQVNITLCGCGPAKDHTEHEWLVSNMGVLRLCRVAYQASSSTSCPRSEKRSWGAAHHSHLYCQSSGPVEISMRKNHCQGVLLGAECATHPYELPHRPSRQRSRSPTNAIFHIC